MLDGVDVRNLCPQVSGLGKQRVAALTSRPPVAASLNWIRSARTRNVGSDDTRKYWVRGYVACVTFHEWCVPRYGLDPPPSRESVEAAARDANAHDFIMSMPDGYDTLVRAPVWSWCP